MKVSTVVPLAACGLLAGCERTPLVLEPHSAAPTALSVATGAADAVKPNFNLEVILRAPDGGDGFGHVKFRQANDDATIVDLDRKSTRLNSSHLVISYAVFCLKKKKK